MELAYFSLMNSSINRLLNDLNSRDVALAEEAMYHLLIICEMNTRLLFGADIKSERQRYDEYFADKKYLTIMLDLGGQEKIAQHIAELIRKTQSAERTCGLLAVLCKVHPQVGLPIVLDLLARIDELQDKDCYHQTMVSFQNFISIDKDDSRNLALRDVAKSKNPTWFLERAVSTGDERLRECAETTREFLRALWSQ